MSDIQPPFWLVDGQQYHGLDADYVALLERSIGIKINLLAQKNIPSNVSVAALMTLVPPDTARHVFGMTEPLLDFPLIILTQRGKHRVNTLHKAYQLRAAVVANSLTDHMLREKYPELNFVPMQSLNAALSALSQGRLDAVISNLVSSRYSIDQLQLENLTISSYLPYRLQLRILAADINSPLFNILQKAIAEISQEQHLSLRSLWFPLRHELQTQENLQNLVFFGLPLIALIFAMLIAAIAWNTRLQQLLEQHQRTQEELQYTKQKLLDERQTLQMILDNAPIGIWLQNHQGHLLFVNKFFCDATGIQEKTFLEVEDYADLYDERTAAHCRQSDREALKKDGPLVSYEKIVFADGHEHELEVIKARLLDAQGHINGLIGLSVDITARRAAEKKLEYQAFFDGLTKLPNRNLLMEQLKKSLALARNRKHYGALLCFDLDNFKVINDSLGHQAGDRLLELIGKRLAMHIHEEDMAARLGGDEFSLIIPELSHDGVTAVERAQSIAENLQAAISQPYLLNHQEYHITPSVGIAIFPIGRETAEDVLKYADTAMYRAKDEGRNAIRFFLPRMQQAAEARLMMQNALRTALEQQQFELYYQPQVTLQGELIGAEALIRWHHQERGMVSPAEFIPLAEDTGMVIALGEWVLQTACHQLRAWQQAGLKMPRISINLSPRQFHQPHFVSSLIHIVQESGVNPQHVELEVTERILIQDNQAVKHKMEQLKSVGLRFAIDDFGTGYSSLSYIKSLPLDLIKIDQSFVRDITTDQNDAVIVETIISMANHLGLELLAEGVENRQELEFLHSKGCLNYQGYYFSRPLPATTFFQQAQQGFSPI